MNISKKWSAVAAAGLSIALVAGGAVSANAAPGDPLNPQPNGSKGSFFIYDANTGEYADAVPGATPTRVYTRSEALIASASSTDVLAEINPLATRPVTGAASFTGVYKFLSAPNAADRDGGENTWNAYSVDSASGPNGGTLTPDFTLNSFAFGPGGIADDIAAGGTYWYGVAYTINNGVTVVGTVYREITIEAGTGNYTLGAVVVETVAGPVAPVEADLTAPLQSTGLVTETIDSKSLAINAGVANANKTLTYGSFPAGLTGQVILDANGVGTINAAAVPVGQATKLWLSNSDYTGLTWDSFTLTATPPLYSTTDNTDLTVEVTNSGRFELVAPAATTVDLGDVRRNRTTTPVALGNVTVFDDRDVLSGWNLNISAAAFQGAGATTVAATALGYSPVGVSLPAGVTLGADKLAGEGSFGILAQGAAGSATGEFEGAVVNTNLTFKAPVNAAKGVHTSTLTLDLVSK